MTRLLSVLCGELFWHHRDTESTEVKHRGKLMAQKFGFGIVGCGMIANFHAMAIEHIKGAKIVACFDNFGAAAEKFAAANKCKKYDKLEDMLKDPAVDIVTICTPSGITATRR